jgi:hypothetical protein
MGTRAHGQWLAGLERGSEGPERPFWRDFDTARPRILGSLLDAVSLGLRKPPDIHLEHLPRMADFALWAAA